MEGRKVTRKRKKGGYRRKGRSGLGTDEKKKAGNPRPSGRKRGWSQWGDGHVKGGELRRKKKRKLSRGVFGYQKKKASGREMKNRRCGADKAGGKGIGEEKGLFPG